MSVSFNTAGTTSQSSYRMHISNAIPVQAVQALSNQDAAPFLLLSTATNCCKRSAAGVGARRARLADWLLMAPPRGGRFVTVYRIAYLSGLDASNQQPATSNRFGFADATRPGNALCAFVSAPCLQGDGGQTKI
ncbi:hypothetical protein ACN47E_002501 [Coniothyrium glycines]